MAFLRRKRRDSLRAKVRSRACGSCNHHHSNDLRLICLQRVPDEISSQGGVFSSQGGVTGECEAKKPCAEMRALPVERRPLATQRLEQRAEMAFVSPPAADRRRRDRFSHLQGAGGSHRPACLMKPQTAPVPLQTAVTDEPAADSLLFADQIL